MDGRQARDKVGSIQRILHVANDSITGILGTTDGIIPLLGQGFWIELGEDRIDLLQGIRGHRNGTGSDDAHFVRGCFDRRGDDLTHELTVSLGGHDGGLDDLTGTGGVGGSLPFNNLKNVVRLGADQFLDRVRQLGAVSLFGHDGRREGHRTRNDRAVES